MEVNDMPFVHGSSGTDYLLDNSGKVASARFDALSAEYDRNTIDHLEKLGVSNGWRCLEVGGGGGSIATWPGDRVGSTGRVLLTDINPRFLESFQAPKY